MKWSRGTGAGQIEDRRGQGVPTIGMAGGGLGLIGLIITLLLGGGGMLGGGGPSGGGGGGGGAPSAVGTSNDAPDPDDDQAQFMAFVMKDVQDHWSGTFQRRGESYDPTKLVLFTQATQTGCGIGDAQTGPFYCPVDSKVYLDLGFFQELRDRFGAPGDFAQAYVIAHEVGHHVQNLLGTSDRVHQLEQRNPDEANAMSVRLELQADCYAGVWGSTAAGENLLERGDLEEGLDAAAAVGDDRIQKQATGHVDPESWTHGSSEQRMTWFRRGFDSASMESCDTFSR